MSDKTRDYLSVQLDRVQLAITLASYAVMLAALAVAVSHSLAAYRILLWLAAAGGG